MAEQLGYHATLEISTDGGSNYDALTELMDSSLSHNVDILDATSNDDSGWKTNKAGHKQIVVSGSFHYDKTDTAQINIIAAWAAGTQLYFRLRPYGNTSGHKEYLGYCDVSSCELGLPTQALADVSFELQSSGAVTYQDIT